MKRRSRKQYFSLIFVPDQEQDPKSVSMSYTAGRFLIGLLVVFSIHIIVGGIGYYRVFRLEKITSTLQLENQDLKARNRQIEQISKQLIEIQLRDEKIRKAFGQTLGLVAQNNQVSETSRSPTPPKQPATADVRYESSQLRASMEQIQNNRYFLTEERRDYFDPEWLPTGLPVEGYLTTRFQKGGWFLGKTHNGIDLAAKKGTVIRAAGAGIVILSDWTPDFGNVVLISHGNGFFTYYAHAMRLLVDQGTQVRKGQQIALLGSSGKSSAPHLHFEIWKDGEPIDPEKFLFALKKSE